MDLPMTVLDKHPFRRPFQTRNIEKRPSKKRAPQGPSLWAFHIGRSHNTTIIGERIRERIESN